jgi:O-antigen ligase
MPSSSDRTPISEWLFLVIVVLLPVMRPVIVDAGRYQLPIVDFIFPIAAAATAVDAWLGRVPLPPLARLRWLWAYGAAITASAVMSIDRQASLPKLAGCWYLIGLALLAVIHVRTMASLRRALMAWMAGTIITVSAAGAAVVLFAAGFRDPSRNPLLSIKGSLPEGAYPRVSGLFLNPNMYCAYLTASLAFVVVMWRQKWLTARSAAALGAAIVAAALLSLSPGFGGILLVIAYVAWSAWRTTHPWRARAALVVGIAGAAAFVIAITASPPPNGPLSLATFRPASRLLTWRGSLAAFPQHPIFGKGLGLPVVGIMYVNPSGIYEWLTDAHNTWLSILVQSGLVGLACFVGLTVSMLRETHRSEIGDTLTLAVVAGLMYQTLSGSFENTRHIWMLIGFALAAAALPRNQEASTMSRYSGPPAAR